MEVAVSVAVTQPSTSLYFCHPVKGWEIHFMSQTGRQGGNKGQCDNYIDVQKLNSVRRPSVVVHEGKGEQKNY
jgi:hypothetical protein